MPEQQLYLGTSQLAASYLGTVASTIYDKTTVPYTAEFLLVAGGGSGGGDGRRGAGGGAGGLISGSLI